LTTTEVVVAEICFPPPEPDHHADGEDARGNSTSAAQWELTHLHWADGIITAWTDGIEIEGVFHDADDGMIELLEGDAHKLLAAIAEHRKCARVELERIDTTS
jgi:hypothetical protein